jgi:NAD(P)-dependent dehydrogenase (short-subunit alcohol dehydrogenase family)
MRRLEGKITIVTGAAMGIGEGTARLFAQEGAKVVLADIDEEKGKGVVKEIIGDGGDVIFIRLDVTDEDNWKTVMETTIEHYGKVNVLVNNAGISVPKALEEMTLEEWNKTLEVNSTGVFLGTKHAVLVMKDNGEANSNINRCSAGGNAAAPLYCAYCASKGSVRLFTKAAALEVAAKGYNIRVNSVHPGWVRTPMAEYEARAMGYEPEEFAEEVVKQHPIGFLGEPIDIAYIDVYLASDESRWVTGAEFVVDGGYLAQ